MGVPDSKKLYSCHMWGWKNGLKTGMYYLRTKSAVDAIKFTIDNTKKEEVVKEKLEAVASTPAAAAITPPPSAEETAQIPVEPLTPEELKQIISQSKENEDDDCLMCGS